MTGRDFFTFTTIIIAMKEPAIYSRETEQAMLAAIINDIDLFWPVSTFINYTSFFEERHTKIFVAISNIASRNEQVDYNSVRMELERHKELLAIGGPEYLAELALGFPTVANIEHHARILYEYELKRELTDLITLTRDWLQKPASDPTAILDDLHTEIEELTIRPAYRAFCLRRDSMQRRIINRARTLDAQTSGEPERST